MNPENQSHIDPESLEGPDLDIVLRALKEALKSTEERHDNALGRLTEAKRAVDLIQVEADDALKEQKTLKRLIGSRHLFISFTYANDEDSLESPGNTHTESESNNEAPGSTSNQEAATNQKRRLNVRGKLVSLITNAQRFQTTREIYDLACAEFNRDLPLSTVNGSLSILVEDGLLHRFPSNEERTSLYGPPEWFINNKPKQEYMPGQAQNPLFSADGAALGDAENDRAEPMNSTGSNTQEETEETDNF
ncbi:hypothetical protein ACVWYF_002054 [Hymenobacter sp. UYAg731]